MDIVFASLFILGAVFLGLFAVSEDPLIDISRLVVAGLVLALLGGAGLVVQRLTPPLVLVTLEDDPIRRESAQFIEQGAGVPLRQIVAEFDPQCAVTVDQRFPLAVVMGVARTQRFPRHCDALTATDRAQIEALTATLSQPL